ncbi:MAG: hypothetical protein M0Z66_04100 [Thermaerobacter sp.]|nr:hypothetical protein [Thermaerobacter sp.]
MAGPNAPRRGRTAAGVLLAVVTALTAACGTTIPKAAMRKPAPISMPTARITGMIQPVVGEAPWSLTGLDFLTAQRGFAVGTRCGWNQSNCVGGVATTSDGGQTLSWTALGQLLPTSVQFIDSLHGLITATTAGGVQSLLGTDDGGETWRTLERGEEFLQGPRMLSQSLGYGIIPARGYAGPLRATALVRTEDGGSTWETVGTEGYYPMGVDFVDARHGYLAAWRCTPADGSYGSCSGAILGTADGGATWQVLQSVGSTGTGNVGTFAVDFVSPEVGFAELPNLEGCTMGGCLSALEGTADGGRTWQPLQKSYRWGPNIQVGWPSAPQFTSPEDGWISLSQGAGGGAGGFLVTTDGGRSFRQFAAMAFDTGALFVLPGMAYAIAALPESNNGGSSALVRLLSDGTVQQVWPAPAPALGLGADPGGTLCGFGLPSDASALLQSTDSGKSWGIVGDLPGQVPRSVSFAGAQRGYAIASTFMPEESIRGYQTTDGGQHWQAVGAVLRHALEYAHIFSGGIGVAASLAATGGEILRSADGGKTWYTYGKLPNQDVWSIAFETPRKGFAYVGQAGQATLYATADGGRHWNALLQVRGMTHTQFPGLQMAIAPSGFGIVQRYAYTSQYLVTRDGGRSWSALNLSQLGPPNAVAVAGRSLALILTRGGLYTARTAGNTGPTSPERSQGSAKENRTR